jgi:hypothetical protein
MIKPAFLLSYLLINLCLIYKLSATVIRTASVEVYTDILDAKDLAINGINDFAGFQFDELNISDYGLESGILKYDAAGDFIYTEFGVQFTVDFSLDGTFEYPELNEDADSNGIFDYFEHSTAFDADTVSTLNITYNSIRDQFGNNYGSGSYSTRVDANFARTLNSPDIKVAGRMEITQSNVLGTSPGYSEEFSFEFTPIVAGGTIEYRDDGTFTLNLDVENTNSPFTSSVSGTWTQEDDGSISFSEYVLPSMADEDLTSSNPLFAERDFSIPLSLNPKSSNAYHVQTEHEGMNFYVVVTDDNDTDSDGVSDLGDQDFLSAQGVDPVLNGWVYWSEFPWLYSVEDETWYYLAEVSSPGYLFDPTNFQWETLKNSGVQGWVYLGTYPWVYSSSDNKWYYIYHDSSPLLFNQSNSSWESLY